MVFLGKNQKLVLGPPGCGKTTRLLSLMEDALDRGVPPNRIAYCSFTRKAVQEAVARACDRFGFTPKELPYFRTLHSLSFQECGITKDGVMGRAHYREISKLLGIRFTGFYEQDGLPSGVEDGDKYLFLDSLARSTGKSLQEIWHSAQDHTVNWHGLERFSKQIDQYKRDTGVVDYVGMLELFTHSGPPLPVDVAFLDEAQDLSRLQWAVAARAFSSSSQCFIAGDDDQAIFQWAGADVETFLTLPGTQEVLGQSYRLPISVYELANRVIRQVPARYEKQWLPRNEQGIVDYQTEFDNARLETDRTTLILVRNAYQLEPIRENLRHRGVIYRDRHRETSVDTKHLEAIVTWENLRKGRAQLVKHIQSAYEFLRGGHGLKRGFKAALDVLDSTMELTLGDLMRDYGLRIDAIWHEAFDLMPIADREYYLTILRQGGSLTKPPKVAINTIHGVKGGEADDVIMCTDLARRTFDEYQRAPDAEHRVMYVGLTRARERLTIVQPQTPRYYLI